MVRSPPLCKLHPTGIRPSGNSIVTPKKVLGGLARNAASLVSKCRSTRNDIRRRLNFRRKLRSKESKARWSLNECQLKEAEHMLQHAKDIAERLNVCVLCNTPQNVNLLFDVVESEEWQQHK